MLLLFSGGMDSYIAYHYLNKPKTLYIDIGHKYNKQELDTVKKLIPETIYNNRLYLGDIEKENAHIPMRNAYLLMIASEYDNDIALIVQKGEMDIPDRSKAFFNDFGKWLSWQNEKYITINGVFYHLTKTQMVEWYIKEGLNIDKLLQTRSCYSNYDIPCGRCSACFRRWIALTNNNLSEKYKNDIRLYKEIPIYIDKMNAGKYEETRTNETFKALKKVGII